MNCPACKKEMSAEKRSDITVDVCNSCNGVWLDKGELNEVATGLAGDIEYSTLGQKVAFDKFPERNCPKCDGWVMSKVALLTYTDTVFDYCPNCQGFFLDGGEVSEMNEELKKMVYGDSYQEFRGDINGRLVRMDKLSQPVASAGGLGTVAVAGGIEFYVKFSVFFKKPLNIGLQVFGEKITDKILKVFRLSKKQDIVIGDKEIDKKFIVQGTDIEKVKELFLKGSLKNSIKKFVDKEIVLDGKPLKLEINDDKVVAYCGLYPEGLSYDVKKDDVGVIKSLVEIATSIEE